MSDMHGQRARIPAPASKPPMTALPPVGASRQEAGRQQEQASRYLMAQYGPDVLYRAPETYENLVERWIWSVASGLPDYGEECIEAIEAHCAGREK